MSLCSKRRPTLLPSQNHTCGYRVVTKLIDEHETAGGAVLFVGVDHQRRGDTEMHATDVVHADVEIVLPFV